MLKAKWFVVLVLILAYAETLGVFIIETIIDTPNIITLITIGLVIGFIIGFILIVLYITYWQFKANKLK